MGCFTVAAIRGIVPVLAAGLLVACSGMFPSSEDGTRSAPVGERPVAAPPPMEGGLAAVRSRVAENAMKNKDYTTAERMFREAHETSPDIIGPLVGLGEALYALGRYDEAVAAFRAALVRPGDQTDARDGLAKSLITSGHYAEAREILEVAVKARPSAALLNKLGVSRDLSGDGEGAQEAYRAALALEPGNRSARNNLALSLAISGRHQDAVAEMERVAGDTANDPRYRGNLAFVYGLAGDYDAVKRVGGGSGGQDPTQLRTRFDRIRALAASGDRAGVLAMIADSEIPRESSASIAETSLTNSDKNISQKDKIVATPMVPADTKVSAEPSQAQLAPPSNVIDQASRASSAALDESGPMAADRRVPTPGAASDSAVRSGEARLTDQTGTHGSAETVPPAERAEQIAALPVQPERNVLGRSAAGAGPDRADPAPRTDSYHWRVQVGAYRTLTHAQRGGAILLKRVGDLLPSLEALVLPDPASATERFVAYRLRTQPLLDKEAATALCRLLQMREIDCLVVRQSADVRLAALVPMTPVTTAVPVAEAQPSQDSITAAGGWRVQLAAYRSLAHTKRGQEVLMKQAGDLLPDLEQLVRSETSQTGSGVAYRLRTPELPDRSVATALCNTLQERGIGCLVVQQLPDLWGPASG